MQPKVVFVIGPESTGSTLIARICGHVLCGIPMNSGEKTQWKDQDDNQVWHVSLPSGAAASFPDIDAWISKYKETHAIHFVLTTRDITLSEFSRRGRFMRRGAEEVKQQSQQARDIMIHAMGLGYPWHIVSYETTVFLGAPYLDLLYRFIGVESDFLPPLRDANLKRLESMGIRDSIERWLRRSWFAVRGGPRKPKPDDTRFPASEEPPPGG
ncbi:MAG: hypothetical protein P8M22_12400 [Phycisphaerales bacterium]|nr:hypothetical protein [Phycisphaerales bacterium]